MGFGSFDASIGQGTRSTVTRLTLVWFAAALAVLPVILHWKAPAASAVRTHVAIDLSYAAVAVISYWFYRAESRRLRRPQAIALVFLIFLLSSIVNQLHGFYVDRTSNYFFNVPNAAWQENLQNLVVQFSPAAAPHSYRFLPNGIVLWMQLGGVRFDAARDIYRLITELLVFYAMYRYARLYTNYLGGLLAMLLIAAVYPISFEWYAGQLTDPLSQLSFLLAFIFLETANFPFFLTTLLIGSLAKETILALAGFYVLFCRRDKNYGFRATILCVASAAVYFGVRLFVVREMIQYRGISGAPPGHVLENWRDIKWQALFLITAGAYIPFLVLGWKKTPATLKRMVIYLGVVIFAASLVFSWLSETRNWMPVLFVLAVIAAGYLIQVSNGAERL